MPGTDHAAGAGVADLADLGLDEGGHLLVAHALDAVRPGGRVTGSGSHPALGIHLAVWCRQHGHRVDDAALAGAGPAGLSPAGPPGGAAATVTIVKGTAGERRWHGAERA